MSRISTSDLEGVLAFLGEAYALDGDRPFPRPLLERLRGLVPSDSVTYSELDRVRQVDIWVEEDPVIMNGDASGSDVYWRLRDQHPVCGHEDRTGDFTARKVSDFVSRAELHRLEIYWEFFRPWDVEYELSVGLDAPLSHTKMFIFDRGDDSRDFTERDRTLLDLLRPHFARLYEAARQRSVAREALAAVERAETALVVLDWADRVAYATPEAQRLLATYFRTPGSALPHEIELWLGERRRKPDLGALKVRRGNESVAVQLVEGALLFEEQSEASLLTERESEILDLVAAGHTNAQIAEALWIAPGTVRKHLENIYEKLGVHSRTAAAAKLRERAT